MMNIVFYWTEYIQIWCPENSPLVDSSPVNSPHQIPLVKLPPGELSPGQIPRPGKLPPRWIPTWVRARVRGWIRFRVREIDQVGFQRGIIYQGGIWLGGNSPWGNLIVGNLPGGFDHGKIFLVPSNIYHTFLHISYLLTTKLGSKNGKPNERNK